MNARRFTVAFFIALLISGLCTYLLSKRVDKRASKHEPEQKYVAPAKPLQAGEILKADNVEMVSWPASSPIHGAFTRIEDLVGRAVLYPIDKGQPILDKYLSAPGSGVGLAGRIPPGMRAIALRSDEVVGVAGFLFPGSHLDVLVTYRTDKSPEPATSTVLQDAEVLAAGHQIEPDPAGKPASVTVVTLLLTPEEAERAVLASTQGSIHFVLRNGADKARITGSPILLSQLSGGPLAGSTPISANTHYTPRAAAPKKYVVETVLGDKLSAQTFTGMMLP